MGMLLTAMGNFDEAAAEFERAVELDPLSLITKTIGPPEAALAELDEREKAGSLLPTIARWLISEWAIAMPRCWLERAYVERSYWLIYLKVDPALDPLRENPRFNDLFNRVFGAQKSPRSLAR
jgi:hypothetical protein